MEEVVLVIYLMQDFNGKKFFYHNDQKGSPQVITDSNGNVVGQTFYEPFGAVTSGGSQSRFDYEGKEFDSVTGDYDFAAWQYDPSSGRFQNQPDAIIQNVYDPQLLNHYSFERNDPYGNKDKTGHNPVLIAFATGVVIPTSIEIIAQIQYSGDIYSPGRVVQTFSSSVASWFILGELLAAGDVPEAAGTAIDLVNYPAQYKEATQEAKKHEGYSQQNAIGFKPSSDPNLDYSLFTVHNYALPFNLKNTLQANSHNQGASSSFTISNDKGFTTKFQGSKAVQEKFRQAGFTTSSGGS